MRSILLLPFLLGSFLAGCGMGTEQEWAAARAIIGAMPRQPMPQQVTCTHLTHTTICQ